MTTITFDTDRLVEDLKSSGLPHDQARAIVRGLVEAQTELATKTDLVQLEQRLIIKIGGMMVVAIAVIAALVKLL
ncbi:MAG: DUF1640 domain-containing protein [Methylococcaceae bacterium]